jgi:hypothetical protein
LNILQQLSGILLANLPAPLPLQEYWFQPKQIKIMNVLDQGLAAALAIHIFVEGRRKELIMLWTVSKNVFL